MASEVTGNYRRIVVRFITEGVWEGRLDVLDELCDPGVINHAAARSPARRSSQAGHRILSRSHAGSAVDRQGPGC
jgi:hypothetical protein